MRAPEAFGLLAVDFFWPRPSFWRTQNDHGPKRSLGLALAIGAALDALDLFNDDVQRRRHELVHFFRLIALHKIRDVTVAAEQVVQLVVTDPSEHARVRNLVTVEVKDR